MMDRRSFFRGLVAAAVATQLPKLAKPAPLVQSIIDTFTITINGILPEELLINEVRNGWYHVRATFLAGGREGGASTNGAGGFAFDATGINCGKGLFVGCDKALADYLESNPGHFGAIEFVVKGSGPSWVSVYVKPSNRGHQITGAQCETVA